GPRQTRYACLYTYLPGSTIAWDAYTRKHLSLLGQTMGLMHRTWQDCSCDGLPDVAATYLAITDHMARYFAAAPVTAAIAAKLQLQIPLLTLQRQQGVLRAAACLPGRQPLHMDFVRSNILFTDAPPSEFGMAISGMLDFEKTALGNPVIDVARTLAFLLVDCKHKTPPAVRRAFLRSGYQKRGGGRLDTSARRLLEPLLDAFLLYDFYKFLRHNPYESLPANEHFTRTRDLLLARRIIDNSC
ncbi:MAG TPA: phosphotransferase, partial [Candidatus Saccharimonadales bacterium]|nr:phosphotransferase [Candidatus Saccharimonadales bacterium]